MITDDAVLDTSNEIHDQPFPTATMVYHVDDIHHNLHNLYDHVCSINYELSRHHRILYSLQQWRRTSDDCTYVCTYCSCMTVVAVYILIIYLYVNIFYRG